MQYLLLIYDDEKKFAQMSQPELQKLMADYDQFSAELKAAGKLLGGNRLQSIATATTVRVRDGKTQFTDGPFAETREQLGGYYLIDAKDLDEATAWAVKIPSAKIGSIEVRPLHAMS
jgi:hypothetical protein